MADATALKVALELMHVPSGVKPTRLAPLPGDVLTLLQIAAGDGAATSLAVETTGRSRDVVRDAAAFYIEQILFAPECNSYRVLGANARATGAELRRNMALLLKWLHPDMERSGNGKADRSMFAGRVTLAWEDLKTPERRAAYDATMQNRGVQSSRPRSKSGAHAKRQGGKRPSSAGVRQPPGRFWRALLSLFGNARH